MPLIIPQNLPAFSSLAEENIFVMHAQRAETQDIRPLRILALNLMPTKIDTETQIARLLANSPIQVQLTLLKTATHEAAHVSEEHMATFYKVFREIQDQRFDGLIVTGAPIEKIEFEQVDYWDEIQEIFEWSKTHVWSTLHTCWGAQAGLYYHYGIQKVLLPEKLSGVFEHRVTRPANPLVRGFDEVFYAPHSRYTGVDKEDIARHLELRVLAESEEAGVYLLSIEEGRQIFVTGHPEYDKFTLDYEYRRDVDRGLAPKIPCNYYRNDDPARGPLFRWRAHAYLLYNNWLNYYVYQSTPYDLAQMQAVTKGA